MADKYGQSSSSSVSPDAMDISETAHKRVIHDLSDEPMQDNDIYEPQLPKRTRYDDDSFDASPSVESFTPEMISSLLRKPLKMCSSSDSVTPGKENSILRRGVRALQLESPPTDFFKRPAVPLRDMNNPALKRAKEVHSLKRSIVSSPVLIFTDDEDDKMVIDSDDEVKEKPAEPSPARVENILPPLKCLPDHISPSPLNRSQSESSVIMKAVERIDSDPMLVGDCSRRHVLPVVRDGKNNDLKEITTDTMAALLKGEYNANISGFEVVDCRYPYEFNGGHIPEAVNLFTQQQVFDRYLKSKGPISPSDTVNSKVLIFHCEFSSKRGPDMCRFLRSADRNINMVSYPSVYYPEIYVLNGGYKAFFESRPELCAPQSYTTMIDDGYAEELRLSKNQFKVQMLQTSNSSGNLKTRTKSFKKLYL